MSAQDAGLNLANTEITNLGQAKNYSPTDISTSIVSDDYVSGGIRHIYYQQSVDRIAIYGTSASVHLKDGEIVSSNLNFLPQLEKREIQNQIQMQALEAVARLAVNKGYPLSQTELLILDADDNSPAQATTVSAAGISNRTIPMKLVYYVNGAEEIQLAWNLFIDEVDDAEYINYLVSAATGEILLEQDLTVRCTFEQEHDHTHNSTCNDDLAKKISEKIAPSTNAATKVANTDSTYHVIKYNVESPNFGTRTLEVKPWENEVASPNGWHSMFGIDYQYSIGNNVDAYSDRDNTNDPTGENDARSFGGPTLNFDHPWDVNGTPLDYTDAAITNLFYMNNIAHDIFYNYGFDEASGNFQEDNFGKGGNGSDNVLAEAQDASGGCNANMATPADGGNPRMQMFLCTNSDGDFDNGVILHEYVHGVSNRLTGGPSAVDCLLNAEQMGEGWSDFFGMVMTMKSTDVETTNRTIGTFMFNQNANGSGLREYPYTTDMNVNPLTYNTINTGGYTRAHGIGSIWATMLWDLNWALIHEYGWNADLYNGAATLGNGAGGNNIALRLVMEGLKMQPCSPGFVDGRDAILAADQALYDGANTCLIWEVFARRGLGYSADQGSSNNIADGVAAFDMPPSCTIELVHTANRANAYLGERLTFELKAINHLDATASNIIITDTLPDNVQFYSASDGGIVNGNIVEWPAFNLAANETRTFELVVQINNAITFEEDFLDDLESGGDNWEVIEVSKNHAWNLQSQYYYSPNNGWFITNADFSSETHLVLKEPLALTDSSELSFNHYFDLENGYDYGLVEISIDGGQSWIDLVNNFTQNGYNNTTKIGRRAFSNKSIDITPNNVGFIGSKADLSPYAGEVATIRFKLLTDHNTKNFGWIVDDIGISNTNYALPNFGNIRNSEYNFDTEVETPIIIDQSVINYTVETGSDTLMMLENGGLVFVDVQANDIDANGPLDTLLTTILSTASNGTATVVNNDSISYAPNLDFVGLDTIIYQVCDELNACESDTLFVFVEAFVNLPPVTMKDILIIDKNASASFVNVLANDSDPDGVGDTLTTSILENARYGTSTVINNDSISYTPAANFVGLDTIVYQACDMTNVCVADTIFITVNDFNEGPTAVGDNATVIENSPDNFINVQANDTDPNGAGDSLLTTILETAQHGIASVINDDSISYIPATDYFGLDTIVYQVCDTANLCDADTLFLTVLFVSQPPVASADFLEINRDEADRVIQVQLNDSDPDGAGDTLITSILEPALFGTATVLADDSISYTPNTGFVGMDTVVYQVCDTSNLCATDTIFITVNDFNEGPTATADSVTVIENSMDNFILVQTNDTDPNGVGDSLLTTIVETASNGIAVVVNEDSINYTPDIDFIGFDTIVYQVCDTANLCDIDTVFIEILDDNFAPVVQPDYVVIDMNTQNVYINVQGNDYDPNGVGDTLTTTIIEGAFHGIAGVIDNDSLIYTPVTDYFGLDTIIYEVCDTSNRCAIDTVFITINEAFFCASDDLEKDEDGVTDGSYVAANVITSAGIIPDTAKVKFVAGTEIILTAGFHAKAGSDFIAFIDDCDGNETLGEAPTTQRSIDPSTDLLEADLISKENNLSVRPNPFRQSAIIDYELGKSSRVWIGLHDVTGKIIHVFVDQKEMNQGQYQYNISAVNLNSGAYWISMRTADSVLTKKIIILQE